MKHWKRLQKTALPGAMSLLLIASPLSTYAQTSSVTGKEPQNLKELLLRETQHSNGKSFSLQMNSGEKQTEGNTYIVKYSEPLSVKEHNLAGATVKKQLPKLGYDVVTVNSKASLQKVVEAYKANSKVESITPSVQYKKSGVFDPKLDQMYHYSQLNLASAQQEAGDREVKVAVIDGGIDINHPDLKDNVISSVNIMDPMRKAPADLHGTHVAGIIAAQSGNHVGGAGVNSNAKILGIDVFNGSLGAYDYIIAEGIMYAIENGAEVINMSLGSPFPSPIIEEAVQSAIESGITVVAAAGNSGVNAMEYPAAYEGVISVGSTNDKKKLSEYSTFGPSVDLVAPGEAIYSTAYNGKSTYQKLSGTSMASPVVAGVASLLKSTSEELTPYEIENILEMSADDLGDKGYDVKFGHGLVNPVAALNFDLEKLPADASLSPEEIVDNAKAIELSEAETVKGVLKSPNQSDWFSTEVIEGDYIQLLLEGSKLHDLGLELYFLPEGETQPYLWEEVNNAAETQKEGYLFEAYETGTLFIGVKDANGNYGESGSYTFTAEKSTSLKDDGNDYETPVEIASFPYDTNEHYLNGEDGDVDYYGFSVEEAQVVRVKLDELPGVDTGINVYMADPETGEEYELAFANNQYISGEEVVVFEALPGYQYSVQVTNTPMSLDEFFGIEFDIWGGNSNLPYHLNIDGKVLPEDADGFPNLGNYEEELLNETLTVEQFAKLKLEQKAESEDEIPGEEEIIDEISQYALDYQLGETVEEFFQFAGDIDLYKFTAEEDAIYNFAIKGKDGITPLLELLQYDELMGWIPISVNFGSVDFEENLQAGLRKGVKYALVATYFEPSFEEYTIKSSKVTDISDASEPNEVESDAIILDGEKVKGNFAFAGDVDMHYLEGGEAGIIGFMADPDSTVKNAPSGYLETPLDPVVFIVEDTNSNQVIDEEEFNTVIAIDAGWDNEIETGSFKRKEDTGYFLVLTNYQWHFNRVPLANYELTVAPAVTNDEDAGSEVTGNVPSDPLPLKVEGKNSYSAKGYVNYSENDGDADWYELNNSANSTTAITLQEPEDLNGELAVYSKDGKLLTSSELYGRGDGEVLVANLPAGPNYIKVASADKNPSLEPYQLKVTTEVLPAEGNVERVYGETRYETSLAFAKRLPDYSLDTVLIASGENYPDALSGGVLNDVVNGTTILINNNKNVIEQVLNEAKRLLKPEGNIVILGGKKAVSEDIEKTFAKEFNVSRISGDDRTKTSIEIAKKVTKSPKEVFVTTGLDFADALSVAPYATQTQIPILLNGSKKSLSSEIEKYVKDNKIKKVTVVGGKNAITADAVSKLKAAGVTEIERISGDDRFQTSLAVANKYYPKTKNVALSNGRNFPDALSGSHFAAELEMPVVLTEQNKLASKANEYFEKAEVENFYLYGGTKAISDSIIE